MSGAIAFWASRHVEASRDSEGPKLAYIAKAKRYGKSSGVYLLFRLEASFRDLIGRLFLMSNVFDFAISK